MAKQKGRPKTSRHYEGFTRIDRNLLAKIHVIARDRRISAAQFITDSLRHAVDKAYSQVLRKIESDGEAE